MNLKSAISSLFDQLSFAIEHLSDEEYSKPSVSLSGSSIGQHVRHTLEFFNCLLHGAGHGVVNYDNRLRNNELETSTICALRLITKLNESVQIITENPTIQLELSYDDPDNNTIVVASNLERELVYNVEHAIHHMALIKIGIREVQPNVAIPEGFGVASSTIQYQKKQRQNV